MGICVSAESRYNPAWHSDVTLKGLSGIGGNWANGPEESLVQLVMWRLSVMDLPLWLYIEMQMCTTSSRGAGAAEAPPFSEQHAVLTRLLLPVTFAGVDGGSCARGAGLDGAVAHQLLHMTPRRKRPRKITDRKS